MTDAGEIQFKIDGEELTAHPGETILQAGLRHGKFIPHYCWHPALSIAGNCRMCLVHVTPGPPGKPVIACGTQVTAGMEVDSSSDKTKYAREGVLEFLLANHPLDCPICDQAGECDLQQYSYDHGRSFSKFDEAKTQRPRKDLGPLIRFNGNRCIVCTRCVRFCEEITGSAELTVVNRSDQSYIDIFPDQPLDNPLSGCTADLCPVGALLETDSIHSTRVWLHRRTKSVCGGCATGCNINVETFDDKVKRITPRENQAVNRWWMSDDGRLTYKEALAQDRLREARVDGEPVAARAAVEKALELLREAGDAVAVLTTGFASNEELFLLDQLATKGPRGVVFRADGSSYTARDGFTISKDKNPNRAGVEAFFGKANAGDDVAAAIRGGKVKLLIVQDGIPGGGPWSAPVLAAAQEAPAVIALSLTDGAVAGLATVALPAQHWTEKDGTFVNGRGRLQRVRAATPPVGDAPTDLEVLQELARGLGRIPRVVSAAGVFRRLAAAHPGKLGGVASYEAIGDVGVPLPGAQDTTPPEACTTYYEAGPVSRHPGRADDEQTRISVHRAHDAGFGTVRGSI